MSVGLPSSMRWERSRHRTIVTTEPFGSGDMRAIVCEVFSGGLGIKGADAAERLIAEAPRMLAALKAMDEAMCSMRDGMSKAERHAARLALVECRAVVAEAEGRASQESA